MVGPDWSGAVSFGHSACLNPWNNDDSPRLVGDEEGSRVEIRRLVATSAGVEVSALTAQVSGHFGSNRRHRPLPLPLRQT
jgi:hypothetical protein